MKEDSMIEEQEEQTLEEALGEAYDEVEEKHSEEDDGDIVTTDADDDAGSDGETDPESEEPEVGVSEEEAVGAGEVEEGSGEVEEIEGFEEGSAEEEEEEEEEELAAVEPNHSWPEKIKEEFVDLPPKSQHFMMNAMKGMHTDYTQKTQAIADVVTAMDPIREECIQNGVSYGDAIRRFVGAHEQLKTKPAEAIKLIMDSYNITPEMVVGGGAPDDGITPAAANRIAELERQVAENAQRVQHQTTAQIDQDVQEFAKTAPHYAEVEQQMVEGVAAAQAMGQPIPSLQELYDRACWINPTVRAKVLAEQQGEKTATKVAERKKRVAKSKKAAKSAKTSTASQAKKPDQRMGLREQLDEAWDEAAS